MDSNIQHIVTLKCLRFGTIKIITFLFVRNGNLMVFRCSNIKLIIHILIKLWSVMGYHQFGQGLQCSGKTPDEVIFYQV